MKEQDQLLRYDKEEIVFTSGGTKEAKIVGMIVFLFGLGLIGAALARWGEMTKGPVPVYLVGSLCAAVGMGIFLNRSEKRFDTARRRWQVSRAFGRLGSKRKGTFEELSEVVVDCDLSLPGEARSAQGPYVYEVRVTLKDGSSINVQRNLRHAHRAFSIANELSGKLSLPLENRAAGKDNIIEMIPPDNAPEPSGRLSTSTFDRDTVTFFIPSGNRLGKKYRISAGLTLVFVMAPFLGISVFAAFIFWDWFAAWLRSGEIRELWNALIAAMFIILPLILVYVIFTRIFMAREELQAGPSGITYRRIYGPWSREKRVAKNQITAVKARLNKFARTPRVDDIMIFAGSDTILVGQGLPDEEKIWIASRLRRLLGMEKSDDR